MVNKKQLSPENPDNIITTWLRAERLNGKEDREALDNLNAALNKSYQLNNVYSWERGKKLPGRDVFNYMLKRSIPTVLANYELSEKVMSKLVSKLTMPGK